MHYTAQIRDGGLYLEFKLNNPLRKPQILSGSISICVRVYSRQCKPFPLLNTLLCTKRRITNIPGDIAGVAFRNDDTGGGLLAPGNESRSSISNLRLALFALRLIAPPTEPLYGEVGLPSPPRPKREPGGVVGKKLAPHLFRLAMGSCSIMWGLPRTSIGRFRVTQVILRPSKYENTSASFKRASCLQFNFVTSCVIETGPVDHVYKTYIPVQC